MITRQLLLLSFALALPALEVVGEPAWLTKTMTPTWRQMKLGEVLDAIGTAAGCPVKRGEDMADIAQGHEVTIALTAPVSLRRVLELLEQTQELVITAETQQMTVARFATWRVAARRIITIDLRDYGALAIFPEPDRADVERHVPRSINPTGKQVLPAIETVYVPDAQATVEYLRNCLEQDDEVKLDLHAGHELVATVNPQEERLLRRELAHLVKHATAASTWGVTFGVLAGDQPITPGIVPHTTADALCKRLTTRKRFQLHATDQRDVHAADQRNQEIMASTERMRDSLLPIAELLTTGWSCELRPIAGRGRQRLTFRLSWSEARPGSTATLVVPPIPADPANNRPASGDQTLILAKPVVWSWEPAGDVFLPDHHALVLVAPHGDGRAVIVVESAGPSPLPMATTAPTPAFTMPASTSLDITNQPVMTALERLASLTQTGLVIHHDAQQLVREEADIHLMDQSWEAVTKSLWLHRAAVHCEDGLLLVEQWNANSERRMERVLTSTATMTTEIRPSPGPRLGVQRLPDGALDPQPLFAGHHQNHQTPEMIEEIQPHVGPDSWSNAGVFIEDYNGAIIVRHTPEIHLQIAKFLADRERRMARQVMVRFHHLAKPPTAPELILDAATWTTLAKNLTPDAAFTVIDGQRNHHFSGMCRAYTAADLFENGLGSPVMGMTTSGLVIEVEPHITVEGISTRIRLQATVSDSMTTSPVKDAAGRLLFDIDLPDQRIDKADDVRLIPPGGAALYRFDDRTYAVSVEPLDVITSP